MEAEKKQIYKNKIINISDKKVIKNIRLKIKKKSYKKLTFQENQKIIYDIKKGLRVGNFHGVAIDSREVKKDNIFVRIKGKNKDGIEFVPKAIEKGAKYIVSSTILKKFKKKFIKV